MIRYELGVKVKRVDLDNFDGGDSILLLAAVWEYTRERVRRVVELVMATR